MCSPGLKGHWADCSSISIAAGHWADCRGHFQDAFFVVLSCIVSGHIQSPLKPTKSGWEDTRATLPLSSPRIQKTLGYS